MVELTAKQEHFSQLLMDPEYSQIDAYREAYEPSIETSVESLYAMSSRVANHVKVRARIQEMREANYLDSPYTVHRLRSKLELRSDDAADAGQYGPSVKALELIGKLDGIIVDRKDINLSGAITVGHIELSTDELRQILADGSRIADEYRLSDDPREATEIVIGALPATSQDEP
jgi:hypothetical protein